MKVIYYTSTYVLDCALEIINILKQKVELHVIIEIAPESKISTIINVAELPNKSQLIEPAKLIDPETYKTLKPYFEGTASTNFIVFSHKKCFSYSSLKTCQILK